MTRSRPDYVKAHARKVSDVMATEVITAGPDTPLHEIASTLEKYAIKRVPIVKDGQLVGIVSRANLIQAVASDRKKLEISLSDTTIRDKVLAHLKSQRWAHTGLLNATVSDGVVDLWGISNSDTERKAIRVAAEFDARCCGRERSSDHATAGMGDIEPKRISRRAGSAGLSLYLDEGHCLPANSKSQPKDEFELQRSAHDTTRMIPMSMSLRSF